MEPFNNIRRVAATERRLRGTDLRARSEVVRWLAAAGGTVADRSGLVASRMRRELGKGRALGQLLAQMEKDGMIERDVSGRRTMRITLVDDWGLVERDRAAARTVRDACGERSSVDHANTAVPSIDYKLLALHLLAAAVTLGAEQARDRHPEPAERRCRCEAGRSEPVVQLASVVDRRGVDETSAWARVAALLSDLSATSASVAQ